MRAFGAVGLLICVLLAGSVPGFAQNLTTTGDARFFIDGSGRAVIVVDQAVNGSTDGYADHVFLLARLTALTQSINISIAGATVQYLEDRVLLTTGDESIHIDLAIGTPAPAASGTVVYRFLDAIEIVHHPLGNAHAMASFGTGSFPSGLFYDEWGAGDTQGCDNGGPGAVSCSNGGGGCSVTCKTGYYACCMTAGNSCTCKKE